jgi:phosphohistidine phosphatase SixA
MNVLRQSMRHLTWCAISLLGVLSLSGLLWAGQFVGDTTPKLQGQGLIRALKKGGYIIYFRHGATSDFGEKDVEDKDLDNCAVQRNLSDEGQAQTRAIGAAFKTLQIPVGEVYSSPYCRCLDTARNIFGKAQKSKALHFAIHLQTMERATVTAQLLALLDTPPAPGSNTALVSHTANLQEAVGIWPKPEGVAHIFKPEGNGQFSYVGMMLPEAWAQEAAMATSTASEPGEQGWLSALRRWFRALL